MRAGNLLVAQGGGPTAVINCSLVGIIQEAKHSRTGQVRKIIGALHGVDGIIDDEMVDLGEETASTLRQLYRRPAAALGSCRRKMEESDYGRILETFRKYDIRYFLYIGGNGSMHTADRVDQLARSSGYELAVVGIPKTIDNDLAFTDHCPGYGSAARYFASVTREIGLDVEALPPPISVIETLGRNAGWLAAASSLAKEKEDDAPNLICFPERPLNLERFLSDVSEVYARIGRAVIVVSEGLKDESGSYLGGVKAEASRDGFGRGLPGGAAAYLAEQISEKLKIRARNEKPGLAARTAIEYVSAVDQKEAALVGKAAVRLVVKGNTGLMTTLDRKAGEKYRCVAGTVSLNKVAIAEKKLPDEFISSNGNYVTQSFLDYCRPLIGNPLLSFGSLTGRKPGSSESKSGTGLEAAAPAALRETGIEEQINRRRNLP